MTNAFMRRTAVTLAALLALTLALCSGAFAGTTLYSGKEKPKYVFLFIGDGLGLPQLSAAQFLFAASQGKMGEDKLLMSTFPVQGITTTYSAETAITDSAAAGTAIASGVKTYNAGIGVDANKKPYRNFTSMAKDKGMKVGIVSSVSLDHATPAAFYAVSESRNLYHEISHQIASSGFDYFAGGGLIDPDGKKSKAPKGNAFEAITGAGYSVVSGRAEFQKLSPKSGKVMAMNDRLPDGNALPYAIDSTPSDISLAEFTAKGIELLDNPKGFFMMVEGGKIDWACHANDAMAAIGDLVAFNEAIGEAVKFMKKHPKETLIVVTGDHETGGLTVGFAGTKYDNFFTVLQGQKVSFQHFTDVILKDYRAKCGGTFDFEDMKPVITASFGLKFEGDAAADRTVLKEFEIAMLQEAFNRSMGGETEKSKDEMTYRLYGGYDPLAVSLTQILNQKAGLGWTTYSHTGVPVATAAVGLAAEAFGGYYDNTDLFKKFCSVLGIATEPVTLAAN